MSKSSENCNNTDDSEGLLEAPIERLWFFIFLKFGSIFSRLLSPAYDRLYG